MHRHPCRRNSPNRHLRRRRNLQGQPWLPLFSGRGGKRPCSICLPGKKQTKAVTWCAHLLKQQQQHQDATTFNNS